MIAFHLPIVPPKATSQSAGRRMFIPKDKEGRVTGSPMFFKNQKAAAAEHDFLMLCSPYRPSVPFLGPVSLDVDFVWPWRASEPEWRKRLGRVHHTSKPDCSNAIKQIEDVLTKLQFIKDDGQVAILTVSKGWGDRIGIFIKLTPLAEPTRQNAKPMLDKADDHPSFF